MDTTTIKRRHSHPAAISLVFFVISFLLFSIIPLATPRIFSSPDETANYFFAERFVETTSFRLPIPSDLDDPWLLHPRSTKIVGQSIVPESFLGLPLYYGLVGKVLSATVIPFLTPILAAGAVVCFYFLLRRILSARQAAFGAVLLMIHPAFIFYANRGMFHNVAFVSLLLIAATLFVIAQKRRSWLCPIAGMVFGIGISFRASEAPWLIFVGLGLLVTQRKILWRRPSLYFLLGAVLGLLPLFFSNAATYQSPFSFGYRDAVSAGLVTETSASFQPAALLFPFGIRVGESLAEAWRYLGLFSFWLTPALVAGLILTLLDLRRRAKTLSPPFTALLVVFGISFVYLALYYGSWNFSEFQGNQKTILGSSYPRYWLPLTVVMIPFMVRGFDWFFQLFRSRWRRSVIAIALVIISFFTFDTVFRDPLYGLLPLRGHLLEANWQREFARARLPSASVLVAGSSDKVFFPEFSVIVDLDLRDGRSLRAFDDIVRKRPVFVLRNAVDANPDKLLGAIADRGYQVEPGLSLDNEMQFFQVRSSRQ